MTEIIPILFATLGGIIGSLYGNLSMLATIPALIASDIPMPADFITAYQSRSFSMLLQIMIVLGWRIGKWRATQIDALNDWHKWTALALLGLIIVVLGFAASIALFFLLA